MSPADMNGASTSYRCRSEPQIAVVVMRTIASVGSWIAGSGTSSTRTSRLPCHATALIGPSIRLPGVEALPERVKSRNALLPSGSGYAPGMADHLAIYLNDHLAGSTMGRELAKRTLGNNRGTEFEPFLERLVEEIVEDRQALIDLMDQAGVGQDRVKTVGALVAE